MLWALAQRKKDMDRAWLEGYIEGYEQGRREGYILGWEEAIRKMENQGVVLSPEIQAIRMSLKRQGMQHQLRRYIQA